MSKVIKGLDKVIKDFKKFGKEGEQIVGDVAFDIANEINADAKRNVPKDLGKLSQSIFVKENTNLNYSIVVGLYYGPYIEFGTGTKVNLDYLVKAEIPKSYALKFKGKGIKQVNIGARPYLYPAFIKGRKSFLKDLEKEFNKLTKKYD